MFTFSVHCAQNLFSAKEFSDCDVEVAAGCGDDEYVEVLESKLDEVPASLPPLDVYSYFAYGPTEECISFYFFRAVSGGVTFGVQLQKLNE